MTETTWLVGDMQTGDIREVTTTTEGRPDDFVPYDDYGDYDPDWACQTCNGDGFEYCEDQNTSEGCWERDCDGTAHTCPNCSGSGASKDQWYW